VRRTTVGFRRAVRIQLSGSHWFVRWVPVSVRHLSSSVVFDRSLGCFLPSFPATVHFLCTGFIHLLVSFHLHLPSLSLNPASTTAQAFLSHVSGRRRQEREQMHGTTNFQLPCLPISPLIDTYILTHPLGAAAAMRKQPVSATRSPRACLAREDGAAHDDVHQERMDALVVYSARVCASCVRRLRNALDASCV